METDDRNLSPQLLRKLWAMAKAKQVPEEEALAAFQKFMVLHEDMHETWERLEKDSETSLDVGGENLLVHIAMDAATMRSLETDQPPGVANLMGFLAQKGFDQGHAFHVISQAMQHEFLTAASRGQEMDPAKYVERAKDYCRQAVEQREKGPGKQNPKS